MLQPDRCYIVAEIGINHNGDMETCKKLIDHAAELGCDAVKFQKRSVEVVYRPEDLARPRENPFGPTNGDLKRGLEFGRDEYDAIDAHCRKLGIDWYASPWDEASVEFLLAYDSPYLKVASACATDRELVELMAKTGKPLMFSTGMADLPMIRRMVEIVHGAGGEIACLYHCTSTYPSRYDELNLRGIQTLQKEFPNIPVGYSGHEAGLPTTTMAAVLGAASVERHITLSRAMWGSDQAASLEITGLRRLVRDIRCWEKARGDGVIHFYESERPVAQKLRRKNTI